MSWKATYSKNANPAQKSNCTGYMLGLFIRAPKMMHKSRSVFTATESQPLQQMTAERSSGMYFIVVQVEKLLTVPLHSRARLLTSFNGPQLHTRSRGAFWGWRAWQRADQLTSFGVSETEPWCAMSGGDMWLTTWPRCLTHWSERESRRGSKDSLYSHLLINGGHHRHLTRLIDPLSLQGLCVSISNWLFQVYSFQPRYLPPNHGTPHSVPPGNFF